MTTKTRIKIEWLKVKYLYRLARYRYFTELYQASRNLETNGVISKEVRSYYTGLWINSSDKIHAYKKKIEDLIKESAKGGK